MFILNDNVILLWIQIAEYEYGEMIQTSLVLESGEDSTSTHDVPGNGSHHITRTKTHASLCGTVWLIKINFRDVMPCSLVEFH
jgi:hypothetical protein